MFKVGDVVIVVKVWEDGVGPDWNEGMDKYVGRDLTITKYAGIRKGHECYTVKEDGGMYLWDACFMDVADDYLG